MAEWIGMNRRARRCYGFDEVALVPGMVTINPGEVDPSFELAGKRYRIPIMAAAMDGAAVAVRASAAVAVVFREPVSQYRAGRRLHWRRCVRQVPHPTT